MEKEASTPGPLVINDPTGPYNYFNAFWHPFYKGTTLHTLQSVTKSVVSLTLGMAIARGDLPVWIRRCSHFLMRLRWQTWMTESGE